MILGNKKVAKTGLKAIGEVIKGISAIGISISIAAISAKAGDMVKMETGNYIDKTLGEVAKVFKK